jgi:hypothetical protein
MAHSRVATCCALVLAVGCYSGVSSPNAGDGADAGSVDDDAGDDADGGSSDGGEPSGPCGTAVPGSAPIRRLSAFEYDNTIADLLGDTSKPAQDFPEEGASGFDNNADVASVSRLQAEKYMRAAEDVAARATEDLNGLLGCDLAADETGCMQSWITSFGARAWRRPLTTDEVAAMSELFAAARAGFEGQPANDARTSVELVLSAFLQSPHFLYRVEFGVPGAGEVVGLGDHEMAARLSYFLWGSMPDDELFAVAEQGELHTRAHVESQARRMLDHPRARAMVLHFHEQWLDYGDIDALAKDTTVFPDYTAEIAGAQRIEVDAFIDHVVWDGEGTLQALLAAPYTFVDDALASYYGLPAPGGTGAQQVTPQDRDVAGVLTQGAILAVHAKPHETHPILRGLFVREQLLCTIPPPPPDDVDITPPPVDPNATTRERYEQHRTDPACSGCHELMDPIGFGLENFDGTGRWRTLENGLDIDASGDLVGTDVDGSFVGAKGLAERLATSTVVSDCVTTQWFRYAYGRTENPDVDACTIDDIRTRFGEADYEIAELLVALTQTDAFMFRPAAEGE